MEDLKYTSVRRYADSTANTGLSGRFFCVLGAALLLPVVVCAQQQEGEIFRFLKHPASPRQAALGGLSVAPYVTDAVSAQANPAILAFVTHQEGALSRLDFFDDVQLSSAVASLRIKEQPVQLSMRWFGYGDMRRYDEDGADLGSLSAYDAAVSGITARKVNSRLSAGVEATLVHSRYGDVAASAVLFSGGFFWRDTTSRTALGITVHHAGRSIEGFYGERAGVFTNPVDHQMPFDIRMGISKKPEHVPVVLHATLHSLHKMELPVAASAEDGASVMSMVSRHVTVGMEVLFSPGFVFRAGFDKYRHDQYKTSKQFDSAGMTFGAGIKRGRWTVDIARGRFASAGNTTQLAISSRF
jgi:hypothetical protein